MASSDFFEIDMSLRLWSEQIPLKPIFDALDVTLDHLHVAGEPMARDGRLAERRARRHYASLENTQSGNEADVTSWCRRVIEKIESRKSLVGALQTGQIVGTLWIAVLGSSRPVQVANLPADVVEAAEKLNLGVLLENYTDMSDGGIPKKTWFVRQGTDV